MFIDRLTKIRIVRYEGGIYLTPEHNLIQGLKNGFINPYEAPAKRTWQPRKARSTRGLTNTEGGMLCTSATTPTTTH